MKYIKERIQKEKELIMKDDFEVIADAIQQLDENSLYELCSILYMRDKKQFDNFRSKIRENYDRLERKETLEKATKISYDFSNGQYSDKKIHKIEKKYENFVVTTVCRPGRKIHTQNRDFDECMGYGTTCAECMAIENS